MQKQLSDKDKTRLLELVRMVEDAEIALTEARSMLRAEIASQSATYTGTAIARVLGVGQPRISQILAGR